MRQWIVIAVVAFFAWQIIAILRNWVVRWRMSRFAQRVIERHGPDRIQIENMDPDLREQFLRIAKSSQGL